MKKWMKYASEWTIFLPFDLSQYQIDNLVYSNRVLVNPNGAFVN